MICNMRIENKYCTPQIVKQVHNTSLILADMFTFITSK